MCWTVTIMNIEKFLRFSCFLSSGFRFSQPEQFPESNFDDKVVCPRCSEESRAREPERKIFPFSLRLADPNFSAPITNVTVPTGREAALTCVVHDLFSYKVSADAPVTGHIIALFNLRQVAWLKVDTQTILTIQSQVITKNRRIGITNTESRIWQLHIKDVKISDQGLYMVGLRLGSFE